MRKLLIVLATIALVAGSYGIAAAAITGSDHDFSSKNWNSSGEICVVCHTPHNSDTTVTNAPLWNHEVTTATFTTYSSATLDATVGQPAGVSKLCLSCHDGTVAIDSFGGATGTNTIDAGHKLGTDLSNDHPVSFDYDAAAAADGGLTASASLTGVKLFAGNVECATCHDPHNGAGFDKLLRVDNAGSALCLTCHNK